MNRGKYCFRTFISNFDLASPTDEMWGFIDVAEPDRNTPKFGPRGTLLDFTATDLRRFTIYH